MASLLVRPILTFSSRFRREDWSALDDVIADEDSDDDARYDARDESQLEAEDFPGQLMRHAEVRA